MVTKHGQQRLTSSVCLNLAKIHMVTKREKEKKEREVSLNLAKIHMVTKLFINTIK